ncbi:MAG: hypothetical protein K6G10_00445 [Butyrivibrio sp.]|nr:hypothetical protein [Butyrivibrio sp.]
MNNEKNKEWYKRSFNTLHLSEGFRERLDASLDDRKGKIMEMTSVKGISRVAAAVITICTVTIGSAGVCYANDVGGIRTYLKLWLGGTKQTVEVEKIDDEAYKMIGEDGKERNIGGFYMDAEGNQTALNTEDMAGYINNDMFLEKVDGRMIFTYKNLVVDVTDKIDDSGNLHVHVDDPSNPNTYFNICNINENGYESLPDSKPQSGVEYFEVDSAGLVNDSFDAPISGDDTTKTTTVVISD